MPLQATSGAATYDAFGGGVPAVPNYIEDVFSTYLYTGNGSTQTITNGIDLSGKGGLVWWKNRTNATGHGLIDTTRGIDYYLSSNTTDAQDGPVSYISSVSSTGYSIGAGTQFVNQSANNYVSWTFRRQPKFFDVVTYTGNGANNRVISHNLGSVPGSIFVKRTDASGNWHVYHRSLPVDSGAPTLATSLLLNTTGQALDYRTFANSTYQTDTTFKLGNSNIADINESGGTYVAYLFAHNAGGFGLTGTDNVISCGSFTGTGSPVDVNLGYEAQWVLIKRTDSTGNWYLMDTMRGMSMTNALWLYPNTSGAEVDPASAQCNPTATGFTISSTGSGLNAGGATYIYIAIRRGPMKVPTSGTSVFYSASFSDYSSSFSTGFVTDFAINKVTYYNPDLATYTDGTNYMLSRLTANRTLATNQGTTESNLDPPSFWAIQDGYKWANGSGYDIFGWAFARAPSFADVVCYTGTYPTVNTVAHNLGVAPELMLVKLRTGVNRDWAVYSKAYSDYLGLQNRYGQLNTTVSLLQTSTDVWNNTAPTATSFQVNATDTNYNGGSLIAYLFATCPGVSKCGLFTGTGSTQTIDCGFTGGARFVMIKRANTTGDWFVYDSSRGIQSGNDPYLRFNSSLPAVTNTNYVDAAATGFQVIGSGLNVNGGIYIFLAIA